MNCERAGATLLWANMLKERVSASTPELQDGLEVIRRSAEAQKALIEDLLDTSRIIAGELRLYPVRPTWLNWCARLSKPFSLRDSRAFR